MRVYRSQKQWQDIFKEQEASGKSVSEFCLERKISRQYFYRKRKKTISASKKRNLSENEFVKISASLPAARSNNIKIRIKESIISFRAGTDLSQLPEIIRVLQEVQND